MASQRIPKLLNKMLCSRKDLQTLTETGETNWTHEALQAVSLTSACFSHFLRPSESEGRDVLDETSQAEREDMFKQLPAN